MENRIKAIKEYLKYFPKDRTAQDNLLFCEYAKELKMDIKSDFDRYYYPRVECGYFMINPHLKVGKRYALKKSATGYIHNDAESIIIWRAALGKASFVQRDYANYIEDEWEELKNKLLSYKPLDYDLANDTYIYNIENGLKLVDDYEEFISVFREKLDTKVKAIQQEKERQDKESLEAVIRAFGINYT